MTKKHLLFQDASGISREESLNDLPQGCEHAKIPPVGIGLIVRWPVDNGQGITIYTSWVKARQQKHYITRLESDVSKAVTYLEAAVRVAERPKFRAW